ncbi:MAG: hypothetical protein E7153_13260 [Enterococcus faecium]|uniref:Uncharacterized protein n=1 Tax=Enterococcus mundtii TaxID=53346 RepID=A0A2T5DC02_ENTMU|nr:hypothetical protein [Enterococcus mundtii]MBE6173786.1 hypothetical protein [Enterococcus faecium]PTO35221.1 hypothetical protein C6N14_08475 [Enterococcus mundtii]
MDEQLVKLNQRIARIKDINDPEYDRLVAERNKVRQQIAARNERQSAASSSTSRVTEVKTDPNKIQQLTEKISEKQAQINRIKDMSDPRYEKLEAEKTQLIRERESERLKSAKSHELTDKTGIAGQANGVSMIDKEDLKNAQKMIHHDLDQQFKKLSNFFEEYKFKYDSSKDEKNIKELGENIDMHKKRYDLKMKNSFNDGGFYGRFKKNEKQSELALGNFIEKWKEDQGYNRDTHSAIEKIHEMKETIVKNHNLEKYSMKVNTKQNELAKLQSKKQRINFFSKYIFNREKYRQLKNQIHELKNELNIIREARSLAMKGDFTKAENLFNASERTGTSHEVKQRRLTQKTLSPSLATSIPGPSKLQNKMEASISKSAEIMQQKNTEKLRNSSHKELRA